MGGNPSNQIRPATTKSLFARGLKWNSRTLRRVLLPLPSLGEQKEIVRQLDLVERKLKLYEHKHAALTALFRTLLHTSS